VQRQVKRIHIHTTATEVTVGNDLRARADADYVVDKEW
jgi:hypothetical protein